MSQTYGQPADPDDPWAFVNGPRYSPYNFYTRSVDGRGHGSTLHIKLSTNTLAMVQQVVAVPELLKSYQRSTSNFCRDAVHHRLKFINDHGGNFAPFFDANPEMLAMIQVEALNHAAEDRRERRKTIDKGLVNMRETVDTFIDDGEAAQALVFLEECEGTGLNLEGGEGKRWRMQVEDLRERARRALRS